MKKISWCCIIATILIVMLCMVGCKPTPPDPVEPIKLSQPTNFEVIDQKIQWAEVSNARMYLINFNGEEKRTTKNYVNLPVVNDSVTYVLKVKAVGNNTEYIDSDWSEYTYEYVIYSNDFFYTWLSNDTYEVKATKNFNAGASGRVLIPDTFDGLPVSKIADEGFKEISSIKSVVIPNGITHIGEGAFANCNNLVSLTLADTITHIENGAFSGCDKLEEINFPKSFTDFKYLDGRAFRSTAWYVNQPDGFVLIGEEVLYGYKGEVAGDGKVTTFPEGIKFIASHAFASTNVTEVILPDGITLLGGYTFQLCSNLQRVVLPSNITVIPESMFGMAINLMDVVMPEGLVEISKEAFFACNNANKFKYPSTLRILGEGVFGTASFEEFEVPYGVTTIKDGAFQYCTKLKNIAIPTTVTSIGANMFHEKESALEGVYYSGTESDWNKISIDSNNVKLNSVTIYFGGDMQSALNTDIVLLESGCVFVACGTIAYKKESI